MGAKTSRSTEVDLDQKMIEGIRKHLAGTTFMVQGERYTAQEVVGVFQGRITKSKAVGPAWAAWRGAVKADRQERRASADFVKAFRGLLYGMFKRVDTLSDFGLPARKVAKKAVAVKLGAIAKTRATREARRTMGKKEKAKIHGVVPAAPQEPPPKGSPAGEAAPEAGGKAKKTKA